MSEIVLTRAGHYHVPQESGGSCQAAQIVGVNEDGSVNLVGWTHDGEDFKHHAVEVSTQAETDAQVLPTDHATFHLSRDCPYGR